MCFYTASLSKVFLSFYPARPMLEILHLTLLISEGHDIELLQTIEILQDAYTTHVLENFHKDEYLWVIKVYHITLWDTLCDLLNDIHAGQRTVVADAQLDFVLVSSGWIAAPIFREEWGKDAMT